MALSGVLPITLTPFHEDGSLDTASIKTLTSFYRDQGADALAILGIMGEAHALTDHERLSVVEHYLAAAGGPRLPVVVGCSAPATEVAIDRARDACRMGATAIMLAPPTDVRDPDALILHFKRVADAVTCPLVLQDEPVTTRVTLSPTLIARIAREVPEIHYVKVEAPPTPSKTHQIHEAAPQLGIFGGLGGLYVFEELRHGAHGVMTGFSFPDILRDIVHAYQQGQQEQARTIFYRFLPLIRYEAQLGVGGIAIRKAVFKRRGLIASSAVRGPARPVDATVLSDLDDLLQHFGLQ